MKQVKITRLTAQPLPSLVRCMSDGTNPLKPA